MPFERSSCLRSLAAPSASIRFRSPGTSGLEVEQCKEWNFAVQKFRTVLFDVLFLRNIFRKPRNLGLDCQKVGPGTVRSSK